MFSTLFAELKPNDKWIRHKDRLTGLFFFFFFIFFLFVSQRAFCVWIAVWLSARVGVYTCVTVHCSKIVMLSLCRCCCICYRSGEHGYFFFLSLFSSPIWIVLCAAYASTRSNVVLCMDFASYSLASKFKLRSSAHRLHDVVFSGKESERDGQMK